MMMKSEMKVERGKIRKNLFQDHFYQQKKDLYRKFLFIDKSRQLNEFSSNLHEQKLSNKYHLLLNTSKQSFHQFFRRICHAT